MDSALWVLTAGGTGVIQDPPPRPASPDRTSTRDGTRDRPRQTRRRSSPLPGRLRRGPLDLTLTGSSFPEARERPVQSSRSPRTAPPKVPRGTSRTRSTDCEPPKNPGTPWNTYVPGETRNQRSRHSTSLIDDRGYYHTMSLDNRPIPYRHGPHKRLPKDTVSGRSLVHVHSRTQVRDVPYLTLGVVDDDVLDPNGP